MQASRSRIRTGTSATALLRVIFCEEAFFEAGQREQVPMGATSSHPVLE
jgi:hypothetical protein